MITSIGSAWRTNLQTASPGARDDRAYLDFRQLDYPDIARDVRSFIDRGSCESSTPPAFRGETADSHSNTTAVQNTSVYHSGASSFLVTKTVAAGTAAYWCPQDSLTTTDMHGFIAGETVELSMWGYAPTTGGPTASEVTVNFIEYYSAAWHNVGTIGTMSKQDAWEKLAVRATLSASATGVAVQLAFASAASNAEYVYVDDIEVYRYPTFTLAREDNLIDRGNCESATGPAILLETSNYKSECTFARSSDFARSGDYSYKLTRTGVGYAWASMHDNYTTTDMHGVVPGETIEMSAAVYVPTASGIDAAEVYIQIGYYDGGWTYSTAYASVKDSFEELSVSLTIPTTATGFGCNFATLNTASISEYAYIDDIIVRRHSVPGTHYLSGGYTEHLVTLPDTGTICVKFHPTFAHDTGSDQTLLSWSAAAENFSVYYNATVDKLYVIWLDGGTSRILVSAQYDDGTSYRNINQWTELVLAYDLSTGTTAGSSLWLNKTQDDIAWSGAIDAKSTVFNKMQIRAYNGTAGAFDIAYVRMFPNYVATDADVQNDFKDVTTEEIYWSLDGHATGKTRVNVTQYVQGIAIDKSVTDSDTGRLSANRASMALINANGEFSDDQYAAYVPASAQFNGTIAQKYLRQRNRLRIESWYSGDFDNEFVGETIEGYRRSSVMTTFSMVDIGGADTVAALSRARYEVATIYEDFKLVGSVECNSLLHSIARQARPRVKQYLSNNSFEDATITDAWVASGGTWSRQAAPMFGTYCGRLVPGAGTQYAGQTVLFTGSEKLSVGQTFTFYAWLLSSAAATGANNYLYIAENDSGGTNAAASTLYTLAGGEGRVLTSVSITIADADSAGLFVALRADAGDTIDIDGAMLIQGSSSLALFAESSLTLTDASGSGTVSADYADMVAYDSFGFDVDTVDYTHPWKYVKPGTGVWTILREMATNGLEPIYFGMDENNTMRLRSVLTSGYADTVPMASITDSEIMRPLSVGTLPHFNRIIGHGWRITKYKHLKQVWDARGTDALYEAKPGVFYDSVGVGETWPNIDGAGAEFWAVYGENDWQSVDNRTPVVEPPAKAEYTLKPWQEWWNNFVGYKPSKEMQADLDRMRNQ
jgi:hypothetical protein